MKEYIRTSGFGIIWASTHRFPLCVPTPFKLPCSRIPVPFTVRRPESELRLQPDLKVKRFFHPKYPPIMFIPLRYIDNVYMNLYMQSKFSPIFLWISKFDVKFQNLMSSWGSWSKISKLEQVRDFSFCGCKSSFLKHTYQV